MTAVRTRRRRCGRGLRRCRSTLRTRRRSWGVWLGVVSVVDYLTTPQRPGLPGWDALDESVRWGPAEQLDPRDGLPASAPFELPRNDRDPLRSTIERLLVAVAPVETPAATPSPTR